MNRRLRNLADTFAGHGVEGLLVSRPTAITKTIEGRVCEPFETLWVETPDEFLGGIMQNLANRKAKMTGMDKHPHGTTIEAGTTTNSA